MKLKIIPHKDSTPWNPAYFEKGVYTYDSDSRIRQNPTVHMYMIQRNGIYFCDH